MKKTIFTIITIFLCSTSIMGEITMADTNNKSVVMIIAQDNFRDEEYLKPAGIFKKNGIKVTVASSSLEMAKGMLGAEVKPDILYKDIKVDDYDAVIFVGGAGANYYWNDTTTHKLAKDTLAKGKILAAICIAPVTLANAGVLKGKNATVFSSVADNILKKGAKYTGKSVEVDGNIITAEGPAAATAFGEAIVKALKK